MRAAIFILVVLLNTPVLLATTLEEKYSVPNEWIATYTGTSDAPWQKLSELLRSRMKWIDSFGPTKRHALFRMLLNESPPNVLGIDWQRNFHYSASETKESSRESNDPDFPKSWGLENTGKNPGPGSDTPEGTLGADVSALKAWAIQASVPASTVIAILDSGVNFAHEDFSQLPKGWNTLADDPSTNDDNGHGTSVAGAIAASANNGKGSRGIYSGPILIVKMLDKNANGTTESAIRAIQYAVEHKAKVINASWGGMIYDQALYDSVKWAGSQGVLFVAAAGNSGKNNDNDSLPTYPAAFRLPTIISVAAYDRKDALATFSNFGPETVDLGAPGVEIYLPKLTGYDFSDGTSFATPFVSAAAALALNKDSTLSVSQLKEKILKSTTPLHYYEKHNTQSGGRLNIYNLLAGIEPERPKTPTHWQKFNRVIASEHPYLPNTKETITITHPGAKYLRVHFSRFELENKYDSVRIKDKLNRPVATYSGVLGEFTSVDVLDDTLKLEFLSDFGAQHWGFELDSYEISAD